MAPCDRAVTSIPGARVIADLKTCGAVNLPFTNVAANQAWITAAATAVDILAWTQAIGLTGQMKRARPKTIRYPNPGATGNRG